MLIKWYFFLVDLSFLVVSQLRKQLNKSQRNEKLPRVTWFISFSLGNTDHSFWLLVKGFSITPCRRSNEIFNNLLQLLGWPYLFGDFRVSFLSQRGYVLAKRTIVGPALRRGSFRVMLCKAACLLTCVWSNVPSIPRSKRTMKTQSLELCHVFLPVLSGFLFLPSSC